MSFSSNLIFLGAPGSGKGTQAERLKAMGFGHVSTGDLLRSEIKKGSELGKEVESILSSGKLVDDNTVLRLLQANLNLDGNNYIFDGFPRNLDQAKMLDSEVLKEKAAQVIYFKLDLGVLLERLTNRRTCKDCGAIFNLKFKAPKKEGVCDECGGENLFQREDDKAEVIENRLDVYMKSIEPLLGYYREKGNLRELDAGKSSEEVFSELKQDLGI